MKNYKLELNEEEKRLVEALLFNERYNIKKEKGYEDYKSNADILELTEKVLNKIGVEVK